jgi:hypothetical protein
MNKDEMHEYLHQQMRGTNVKAIEALSITLKKAGATIKPFYKGEKHLYIKCDSMQFSSIETIRFLTNSTGLNIRIKAFLAQDDNFNFIAVPYINVYE